ncbi:hypothetical protein A3A95_02025 [Candidatus Nomurabacteria bacterium RIFCSPLOWO2_01_FULL_39_18]|uniref:Uncharacterized protein n=1 Tax=Candidatus Nomurabacteria bacterium RIFCSPHIGHO2_01_FULL_40_24b TaxID=1801739 RepID=A0A1F6V9Q1_9BACT|nr:MAG: hypothetical protein A2647_00690 [Candidatus Nomurabacteria bacterium RIFCSPHIGHO2_01_FULL_40_24b]OGI90642.1 MAG: hypothetical protein A3A95_02025 [Candidatus Nomurabacteria bacterium RIFCSPLOWO2_01_FULL_39_18]
MNQYIQKNQYKKGFINTIVGAIGVIILAGIAGYLIINRQPPPETTTVIGSFEDCAKAGYPVGESYPRQCSAPDGSTFIEELTTEPTNPINPGNIYCTQDAKLCPDGSWTSRTAPNCEFAPCGVNPSEPVTIQPYNPDDDRGGLYNYPNYSLTKVPTAPISVKYLVEHRSALDQKIVTVRGVVVGIPAQPPCVAAGTCELYMQPSIILADTKDANRNKDYDLMVFVGEDTDQNEYPVGKTVEIKMQITASKTVVYGNKVY